MKCIEGQMDETFIQTFSLKLRETNIAGAVRLSQRTVSVILEKTRWRRAIKGISCYTEIKLIKCLILDHIAQSGAEKAVAGV